MYMFIRIHNPPKNSTTPAILIIVSLCNVHVHTYKEAVAAFIKKREAVAATDSQKRFISRYYHSLRDCA